MHKNIPLYIFSCITYEQTYVERIYKKRMKNVYLMYKKNTFLTMYILFLHYCFVRPMYI